MTSSNRLLNFNDDDDDYQPGIGFMPLVDIVLLLICFYLFVSKSIESYDDPSVILPVMTSVAAANEQPAELVINLMEDGAIRLNSRTIDRESLSQALGRELSRAAADGRPLSVVVRADRRQTYENLDDILRICQASGFSQVLLRATNTALP